MSIIRFPRVRPSRERALAWLAQSGRQFPAAEDLENGVGDEVFHGWRFVHSSTDGLVYFANCIDRGISESEFIDRRSSNFQVAQQ